MKYLKQFSITLFLFIGMIFGLQNCQKDNDNVKPSSQHYQKVRIVNSKEIQGLINKMEQKSAQFSFTKNSNTQLDLEKILEVSDTNGYVNYTFKIKNLYKRDSLFHISNLIVKTDSLGNIVNDFIMDYGIREKDMFDYIFKHKNLNNFKGVLSIYSTVNYTYNMSKNINGKSSEDYTDPCVTVNVGSSGSGGTSEDSINWYGYDSGESSGGGGIDEMSYLEFHMWLYGGEKTYINILSPRYFMITPNFIGNYIFDYSSVSSNPCSNITAGSYGLLAFNEEDIQNYLINIGIENCNQDMLSWIMNNESTFYQMVDLLYDENYSFEAVAFVNQAFDQMIYTGLHFDIERSFYSPVNIDFTDIDTSTEEGKLLLCVYDKLTQSASFKELFLNTFTQDDRINVCMQIGETPGANGTCELSTIKDQNETFYNNTITINSELLNGTHSNFEVAKTIIHEFIHAYLNVLNTECSNYCNTCIFDGTDLPTVIDEFYQDNCSVALNSQGMLVSQSEHAFIFDFMIPAFEAVFQDVGDLLISQQHQTQAEQSSWYYSNTLYQFNWGDFYYYFAMVGLHTNSSFDDEITNNPYQNFLYNTYRELGNQITKECN